MKESSNDSIEIIKPSKVWKECLSMIKENVPPLTYNSWFIPIKPISFSDDVLKIQVPNDFFIEWIDEHYNTIINKVVNQILGEDGKLVYVVLDENEFPNDGAGITEYPKTVQPKIQPEIRPDFESYLIPKYKFDNFIKGEGNQLAVAASIAIAENPGETSFNPFFVYGGVGLGKTHLIQAIGNKIIEKYPSKRVIYLSTEQFTVKFIDAIQSGAISEFSNFYRTMDVLIIDDIQFLVGKEKTQDSFFHLFNTLHQSGKQLILSSDKPPKDLRGLSERLISRFQWGLSADIQAPDFETRIAILKNKSESTSF